MSSHTSSVASHAAAATRASPRRTRCRTGANTSQKRKRFPRDNSKDEEEHLFQSEAKGDDRKCYKKESTPATVVQSNRAKKRTKNTASITKEVDTASSSRQTGQWHRLQRDYIESVTSFMLLKEIARTMMCTTKYWCEILRTLRRRKDEIILSPTGMVRVVVSPLRRYIHGLKIDDSNGASVSRDAVDALSHAMPDLVRLQLLFKLKGAPPFVPALPVGLKELVLDLQLDDVVDDIESYGLVIGDVISSVSQVRHLESFDLDLNCSYLEAILFEALQPLKRLEKLTRLRLHLHLPDNQRVIQFFQSFPSLTDLKCGINWSPSGLDTMLSDRPERWTEFSFSSTALQEAHFPFLKRLVNIKTFHFVTSGLWALEDVSDADFRSLIHSFTQLEEFKFIDEKDLDLPITTAGILETIGACTKLKRLTIRWFREDCSDEDFESMIANLHQLETLELCNLPLRSLGFFERLPHTQKTLRTLDIRQILEIDSHEVDRLKCLKGVRSLSLWDCCELDEDTRREMKILVVRWPLVPPSLLNQSGNTWNRSIIGIVIHNKTIRPVT